MRERSAAHVDEVLRRDEGDLVVAERVHHARPDGAVERAGEEIDPLRGEVPDVVEAGAARRARPRYRGRDVGAGEVHAFPERPLRGAVVRPSGEDAGADDGAREGDRHLPGEGFARREAGARP